MNVDGRLGWMIMELPSPIMFCLAFWARMEGLDSSGPPKQALFLVVLYVVHYLNRAVISPLRTASRSPSHIIIPIVSILFNVLNGSLIGTYIAALYNASRTSPTPSSYPGPAFLGGILLFVAGFASNVWHDEVLLKLRNNSHNGPGSSEERYKIPYGGLYRFISFPNYLSEWLEWIGYAVAATSLASSVRQSLVEPYGLGKAGWYTPPWMFVAAEIAAMLPRAVRGHQWYRGRFGEAYPSRRKAVFPFLL
ncbi:3-oxo-5-alpha-steroid 4-dehydrogenase-domain-containing protein [Cantharellus anzutake]|uniref:3-oxo-5-alpha-steroid 4-dehydrogenase-domain-containing protein n=1 Tax=Cantharellus anzutake TaxID=1750568 RepID=UPI001905A3D5|nr:3-oxo-5-alpha-steroid 4-dehydrogenase-domain-containing protein [Cantharellus anzutake]XP_038918845.1 3-oxo-5-alpha-steroid 4-dehydrogenase-domain-containing protein [Cantharellus anzutake]KAF8315064.1 3-oxo-5-alpha-steroid 4-dehydrogenase-domain-containing protein [Cantharellus anzutake]KAF8335792.1 3-oxo-5-alpha-steroid 4-dehydrogenase-domain-containing protein [Cantharellus anzutake]